MASNNIRFSVIIPTYNSGRTLKRCLDSIVSQRYDRFEILLIDGASTDDTLGIITDYRQRYPFIHYRSGPDRGIYDAMNKGIDIAAGDWLYFLGSDDTLYNDGVLAAVAGKIDEGQGEVIYGSVVMRGQNKWNLDNVVFDGEYTMPKFIDRNICHQAIFYKATLVKTAGYFSLEYITNADFDYNLRCYARSAFVYADLIIANFHVGGQSSHTEDHLFHRDRGALLTRYFGSRIYSPSFTGARLYLKRAALAPASPLGFPGRIYCLGAYLVLKIRSMFNPG
ncbi:glycosyltransferase family 2 protein [Mucilaginibacter sp. AW1-7]|uniref:glycosyltransferase family 2 protein n=1 Tax=Mucilaginibacter sp. AW1-7 TaxID=3349874 RepID=UPI003F74068C